MSHPWLREIPSVTAVLDHPQIQALVQGHQRDWMIRVIQRALAQERRHLQDAGDPPTAVANLREVLLQEVVDRVCTARERLLRPTFRRVINGTGVIVHTNLGRSLFPEMAIDWAAEAARHFVDLEFDLRSGTRGHRGRKVEEKAALLAGAEDALIVNNNAAAVWLAVRSCAGPAGRVLLSRGESVAIGGSFRMHEILTETGAELVEVGTTNRTTLEDYRQALRPGDVVLKVHRSNFHVVGFTQEAGLAELAELCRAGRNQLIYDAGSGALFPFGQLGLPTERMLPEDLDQGPDLVCCSGDKLLGGCQAGLVLGKAELIGALRRHTMRRAFRVDKTALAALDAVLTLYLAGDELKSIPTLEILARPTVELARNARQVLDGLREEAPPDWEGAVLEDVSSVGGGSFSNASIATSLLLWRGPKPELEDCHARLRQGDPALVTRMNQDGLAVDMRTVAEAELALVVDAFLRVWAQG